MAHVDDREDAVRRLGVPLQHCPACGGAYPARVVDAVAVPGRAINGTRILRMVTKSGVLRYCSGKCERGEAAGQLDF